MSWQQSPAKHGRGRQDRSWPRTLLDHVALIGDSRASEIPVHLIVELLTAELTGAYLGKACIEEACPGPGGTLQNALEQGTIQGRQTPGKPAGE
eukprot:8385026-Alexandrium_andersonii.AAC.1